MHRLLPLLVVLCACGSSQPGSVDVTLSFGASIDAATRATVVSFAIHASGDETFDQTVTLDHPAASEERFVYLPKPATRALTLTVRSLDAGDVVLASGMGSVVVPEHGTHSLEIVLERPGVNPDGGAHFDGGVDAAMAADLASDDLATSACGAGRTCITFEGDPGDSSGSLVLPDGTSCEIESGIAHGGTHAGHCSGSTPNYFALNGTYDATQPRALRAWIRTSANATPTHANFIGYYGTDYVLAGTNQFGDYTANISGGNGEIDSAVLANDSSWHCIELTIEAPSTVTFYLDNMLAPVGTDTTAGLPASFASVILGVLKSGDQTSGTVTDDVYVDDVVLATTRVGCD